MACLGWLLNLGFAGGGEVTPGAGRGNTWEPQQRYHEWEPAPTSRTWGPDENAELGKNTWTPTAQNE